MYPWLTLPCRYIPWCEKATKYLWPAKQPNVSELYPAFLPLLETGIKENFLNSLVLWPKVEERSLGLPLCTAASWRHRNPKSPETPWDTGKLEGRTQIVPQRLGRSSDLTTLRVKERVKTELLFRQWHILQTLNHSDVQALKNVYKQLAFLMLSNLKLHCFLFQN